MYDQDIVIYRNAVNSGDGLHACHVADVDFGYPEGATDMGPLLAVLGGLHGAALVGAELALGLYI